MPLLRGYSCSSRRGYQLCSGESRRWLEPQTPKAIDLRRVLRANPRATGDGVSSEGRLCVAKRAGEQASLVTRSSAGPYRPL